jgi:myo-inositol-1(or 4)-monophosphatase
MTDKDLLPRVVDVARAAGTRLLEAYTPDARPTGRPDMFTAGSRNEELADGGTLRNALARIRPLAGWVEEDAETGPLGDGEWWAVDAVEGNVNHVHGLPDWCVSVTLLRDQTPVLAVVYQPVGDLLYTAARGAGARRNGAALRASRKTDMTAAIAITGQAEADQRDTYRRIGDSITAMLGHALMVKASVPSTFPMLMVAAGQADVFWQYEPVLPGVAAGILLVTEAGGVATRVDGSPWRPGATDILIAAPGLAEAAADVLKGI